MGSLCRRRLKRRSRQGPERNDYAQREAAQTHADRANCRRRGNGLRGAALASPLARWRSGVHRRGRRHRLGNLESVGAAALLAFFASSTLLGRLPQSHGRQQRRGNERDAVQVLANGGVAAALALAICGSSRRRKPLLAFRLWRRPRRGDGRYLGHRNRIPRQHTAPLDPDRTTRSRGHVGRSERRRSPRLRCRGGVHRRDRGSLAPRAGAQGRPLDPGGDPSAASAAPWPTASLARPSRKCDSAKRAERKPNCRGTVAAARPPSCAASPDSTTTSSTSPRRCVGAADGGGHRSLLRDTHDGRRAMNSTDAPRHQRTGCWRSPDP